MSSFGNSMSKLFLVLCLAMLVQASKKRHYSSGKHDGNNGKFNPCTEDNNGYLKYPFDDHNNMYVQCFQPKDKTPGYKCKVQKCDDGLLFIEELKACDINECDTENGGCQHHCENFEGRYECSCEDGFELNEDKHNCTEVNDCVDHLCGELATCEDGLCTCEEGLFGSNCNFYADPVCGHGADVQTFANGTTVVPASAFDCLISLSRGQDDSNYMLSVELYRPDGVAFLEVFYNFRDRLNTDVIKIRDSCISLFRLLEGRDFNRQSDECRPMPPDLEDWFELEVVVSSDSDIPKIFINGNPIDNDADGITLPDPKNPKVAAGGVAGKGVVPVHFRNYRME